MSTPYNFYDEKESRNETQMTEQTLNATRNTNETEPDVNTRYGGSEQLVTSSKKKRRTICTMVVASIIIVVLALVLAMLVANKKDKKKGGIISINPNECDPKVSEYLAEYDVTYILSYCGDEGNYCESLQSGDIQYSEECANDANFVDEDYLGSYTYVKDYFAKNQQASENDCKKIEAFNPNGASTCQSNGDCRGKRYCTESNQCAGDDGCGGETTPCIHGD